MKQRLARIDGTLTIESAVGAGTTINATVPLTGPPPGDH
jgi:signal transduction histidine kinase